MTKALDPAELARRKAAREGKARDPYGKSHDTPEKRRARKNRALAVPVTDDVTQDQVVTLLDADSDPLSTVARVAEAAGLEPKAVKGLLARVRAQYAPLLGELRAVKTDDLIKLVEDRAWMAVEMIDRQSLAELNAYQRAIIFGVLVDKARILKGLPTHIVSVEDRRQLDQIATLLVKELDRRGMVVSDRGEMIDITPGTVDESRPRGHHAMGDTHVKLARADESEASGEAKAGREGAP